MKAEYKEGPEARGKFEAAMKALFKAPKVIQIKQRPKQAAGKKQDSET